MPNLKFPAKAKGALGWAAWAVAAFWDRIFAFGRWLLEWALDKLFGDTAFAWLSSAVSPFVQQEWAPILLDYGPRLALFTLGGFLFWRTLKKGTARQTPQVGERPIVAPPTALSPRKEMAPERAQTTTQASVSQGNNVVEVRLMLSAFHIYIAHHNAVDAVLSRPSNTYYLLSQDLSIKHHLNRPAHITCTAPRMALAFAGDPGVDMSILVNTDKYCKINIKYSGDGDFFILLS